ncbi:MAG: tRNA pseudouridine(38-40) synthase TruA [Actinomycetota bacterium]
MPRIAILFAYDGTDFAGFAIQPRHRTVQGVLEDRLSLVLREPVDTVGAGRTDRGVHAAGQVVSFDVPKTPDCALLIKRINKMSGPEIMLRAAAVVPGDFSARFSAKRREYLYRIYGGPGRDPFRDRHALWVSDPLDVARMDAAARTGAGLHDFSAFCRANTRSMVRRIRSIGVRQKGDEIHLRVTGDSFCHQMVRSMTGCLLEIGAGKRDPDWLREVIESKDRGIAADVAPSRGLTLMSVTYRPDPFRKEDR